MDYYLNDLLIPITEYEIINPITKESLDLTICNEEKIIINIQVAINKSELYKYNPDSEYYKDKCYPYIEEFGDENTLEERKNNFNNNYLSLCEKDYIYIEYDSSTHKVKCECPIKKNFAKLSEIINSKNNLLYHIPDTDLNAEEDKKSNIEPNKKKNTESNSEPNKEENAKSSPYLNLEYINNKDNINKRAYLLTYLREKLINNTLFILDLIKNKKKDFLILEKNIIGEITSTYNQYNKEYINISNILLGKCETILRNYYNISNDTTLLIIKIDIFEQGFLIPIIDYEIYNSKTKKG